jgi:hypothetical protein
VQPDQRIIREQWVVRKVVGQRPPADTRVLGSFVRFDTRSEPG